MAIGTLLPIYSAAGKLIAAYLDDPVSHSWKKQEYEKLDKERKTTLEKELKSVPKNRIAFAKEALAPYISSVGIPILNWDNKILGGIIVVGFEKTIPDSIDDHRSQYLLQVSDDVSSVFGCQKNDG